MADETDYLAKAVQSLSAIGEVDASQIKTTTEQRDVLLGFDVAAEIAQAQALIDIGESLRILSGRESAPATERRVKTWGQEIKAHAEVLAIHPDAAVRASGSTLRLIAGAMVLIDEEKP